jgi:hypothetical protein
MSVHVNKSQSFISGLQMPYFQQDGNYETVSHFLSGNAHALCRARNCGILHNAPKNRIFDTFLVGKKKQLGAFLSTF